MQFFFIDLSFVFVFLPKFVGKKERMLEFKNVSVALPHGERSLPISVVMAQGELTCLCGPEKSGKTDLLLAVMGLAKVASGYITVDGELVSPDSAAYFRRLVAYVPQHLPDVPVKVSELCEEVFDLQEERAIRPTKEMLIAQWEVLGLELSLYDCRANSLAPEDLKLVLLSLLPLLKRHIILIDDLPQTQQVCEFVRRLADSGAEVLYTCRANVIPCDKIIKL